MKLLTAPVGNPKVAKGLASNYATYILHLAPANVSGYETALSGLLVVLPLVLIWLVVVVCLNVVKTPM
jgi:hypothetical protein